MIGRPLVREKCEGTSIAQELPNNQIVWLGATPESCRGPKVLSAVVPSATKYLPLSRGCTATPREDRYALFAR